jgi:hypothetical protein
MARQGLSRDTAAQLAQKLGDLPLALELAEQTLRRGVLADDLIERVDVEGLTAIDTGASRDASASLFASLMFALEGLPQEDRLRLPMLASLPPSQPIDLATFAKVTGVGLSEAKAMAKRVAAGTSLITFDDADHTVSISAAVRAFLRSLQLRQDRAEANRRSRSMARESVIGISYRRDDAAVYAGRIYDRLSQRFGFDLVFMDVNAILPGEDFVQAIRDRIVTAAAWVVVIGPNWASSANSRRNRRLDDPDDFVRIEVATALERGIPVIPVLVGGAAMPSSEELPRELEKLVRRQAIALDQSSFEHGMDQLIHALEQLGAVPATSRMIPIEHLFYKKLGEINPHRLLLKELLQELEVNKRNRVPILSEKGWPLYIVHRSMIEQFIVKAVLRPGPRSIDSLTLADMLADPEMKSLFEKTFVMVGQQSTLAQAKDAMVAREGCNDVFVTKTGQPAEPVLGLLTKAEITRNF